MLSLTLLKIAYPYSFCRFVFILTPFLYILCIFVLMKLIKIVALALLFVITMPTVVSVFSSFYTIDCELLSCEKPTEEESESEKDIDDLEEYLVSQTEHVAKHHYVICGYSFRGKHFIDVVSDIITPPPEFA